MKPTEMLNQEAYMLFYERVNCENSTIQAKLSKNNLFPNKSKANSLNTRLALLLQHLDWDAIVRKSLSDDEVSLKGGTKLHEKTNLRSKTDSKPKVSLREETKCDKDVNNASKDVDEPREILKPLEETDKALKDMKI